MSIYEEEVRSYDAGWNAALDAAVEEVEKRTPDFDGRRFAIEAVRRLKRT